MLDPDSPERGNGKGEAHNQDQTFKAIRFLNAALHQAKASAFHIREHALDAPTHAVIMQDTNIRFHAAAVKLGTDNARSQPCHDIARGDLTVLVAQRQIAFEPNVVRPLGFLV